MTRKEALAQAHESTLRHYDSELNILFVWSYISDVDEYVAAALGAAIRVVPESLWRNNPPENYYITLMITGEVR